MRTTFYRGCFIVLALTIAFNAIVVLAQKQGERKKPESPKQPDAQSKPQSDNVKLGTEMILVPALATDSNDAYVSDLRKEEFAITEDGVKQNISFFAGVKEPFHIVLLIDSGLSLNPEDLRRVKMAAREILEQLRGRDVVSVVSFNDSVKEGCGFTGDYEVLRNAINSIPPGGGTKVYDAMAFALSSLKRANARRSSIILLTDGVDWRSETASSESTMLELEKSGTVVYTVRYDNRSQIELMLRKQKSKDLDAVFGASGIGSVDSTTVPEANSKSTQETGKADKDPTYKLPMPTGPPIGRDRNRYPDGNGPPLPDEPSRQPDRRLPPDPKDYPDNTRKDSESSKAPSRSNSPRSMPKGGAEPTLDHLYNLAEQYLKGLAESTSGEFHSTEKTAELSDIFQRIVSDLRNQYLLGYYSTNSADDGKFRKISVQATRKDVILRARTGYRSAQTQK